MSKFWLSVVCHKAEHVGKVGEMKLGFILSIFRTEVSSRQRQSPNGSRQADKTGRDKHLQRSR